MFDGEARAMKLEGEQVLLRVFLDTFKQWHHVPTHEAIVERARKEQMAGSTVLTGLEGFGQSGDLLKESPWHLSNNREVVVEIVDTKERIERFLDSIEPMLDGAIATLERAHVIHYRSGGKS
jgi:uncharacterized protein